MTTRAMAGDTYEIPLPIRCGAEPTPAAITIVAVRPPDVHYVRVEEPGAEPQPIPLETFDRPTAKLLGAGPVRLAWARIVAAPVERTVPPSERAPSREIRPR